MARSRLEKLRARRIDPLVRVAGSYETYDKLASEGSTIRYAIGAMQPIDPQYTDRTIEERDRVQNQLQKGFTDRLMSIIFDYQGSVTNDTHIRAYSDVDLLTLESRWYSLEPPKRPVNPYTGDTIADLRKIRTSSVNILRAAFPAADLDTTKAKCINISGGSLQRKIDVVAGAHLETVDHEKAPYEKWTSGISILDNHSGQQVINKPFLHNKQIDDLDRKHAGNLRKAIRFLKSIKYDSEEKIEVSSYDLAGIAYNIFPSWLAVEQGMDLKLIAYIRDYLRYLAEHSDYRETIEVPNKMRKVFEKDGGATLNGLKQLLKSTDEVVGEIEQELSRSMRKVADTRIRY